MVEYFAERYSNLAREKQGTNTLDTQLQYSIRLYCYGAVGMTREWLMKDEGQHHSSEDSRAADVQFHA